MSTTAEHTSQRICSKSSCKNSLPPLDPFQKNYSTCERCRKRDGESKKRKREEAKQRAQTLAPALRAEDAHQSGGEPASSTMTGPPDRAETTLTGAEHIEHPFQQDSDDEDNDVSLV